MEFTQRHNYNDIYNISVMSLEGNLLPEELEKLRRIRRAWNFYDGFHWEELPQQEKPEITENYCKVYVDKFVAFELGKSFTSSFAKEVEGLKVNSELTLLEFINRVWSDNHQDVFCVEMGQMKSITGDSWVQVRFYSTEELDDPFELYPKGRISVKVVPTSIVFPLYDTHDKDKLISLTIQYPIEKVDTSFFGAKKSYRKVVYKQIWTKDTIEVYEGKNLILEVKNNYGIIPFVQIKNKPVAGRNEGVSDLEDIIPLNVELNMKKSDISEIIDYHSAPITIVYGARVAQLEKGANKLWGGLPKDARVDNLELAGDLKAAVDYAIHLKDAMNEIAGVPKGSLGGTQAISNTSGVALQFVNAPIIERVRVKRMCSKEGLQDVNSLILLVGTKEGLITKPEEIDSYDFYNNEVKISDTLPKDDLIELQIIEQEMRMSLESRQGAMERLGKENIESKLAEVDADKKESPESYGIKPEINSGMLNGETPVEQVRKENQGKNAPEKK